MMWGPIAEQDPKKYTQVKMSKTSWVRTIRTENLKTQAYYYEVSKFGLQTNQPILLCLEDYQIQQTKSLIILYIYNSVCVYVYIHGIHVKIGTYPLLSHFDLLHISFIRFKQYHQIWDETLQKKSWSSVELGGNYLEYPNDVTNNVIKGYNTNCFIKKRLSHETQRYKQNHQWKH